MTMKDIWDNPLPQVFVGDQLNEVKTLLSQPWMEDAVVFPSR